MYTNIILLILFVLTEVSTEWVEISQQQYRKPIRMHSINNPFITADETAIEDTTKTWTYKSSSISNYNWTRANVAQPYITEKERTQSIDAPEVITKGNRVLDDDEFELKPTKLLTESSDAVKQKGSIERVPNKGSVKRVQLKDNAVKSPVINNNNEKYQIHNDRYEEFPLDNAQDEFKGKKNIENKINNRRIYLNTNRDTTFTNTFPTIEDETYRAEIYIKKKRLKEEYKNHTIVKDMLLPTPTFVTELEEFTHIDKPVEHSKITQSYFTTETPNLYDDFVTNYNIQKMAKKQANTKNNKDIVKGFEKQVINKMPLAESNNEGINNDQIINKYNNEAKSVQLSDPENKLQSVKEDGDKEINEQKISKGNKAKNKTNNMENLLKLLKAVTDTISQNSQRSFGGKVRYLNELKDSILANIAERIDATWPDDDTAGSHRSARSAKESPRGHPLHFPSSESALMTISFLTFAVFLIKLVLQLIQTYKNKAMMVAPVMVASASRSARTHRPHR